MVSKSSILQRISRLMITFVAMATLNAQAQIINEEEVDLRPLLSLPKNQGNSNACAFFAVSGAMEIFPGVPKLSESKLYADFTLDRLEYNQVFDIDKTPELETYFTTGIFLSELASFLKQNKIKPAETDENFESDYPKLKALFRYANKSNALNQDGAGFKNLDEKLHWIQSNYTKENQVTYRPEGVRHYAKTEITVERIKNHLKNKTPIIVSMKQRSFKMEIGIGKSEEKQFFYKNEWKLDNSGKIGFNPQYEKFPFKMNETEHTVLIVGFKSMLLNTTDTQPETVYLIRNSWGTDWGNYGYGYITEKHLLNYISSALIIESYSVSKPNFLEQRKPQKQDFQLKISVVKKTNDTGDLHLSLIRENNEANLPKEITYLIDGVEYTEKAEPALSEINQQKGVILKNIPFIEYMPKFLNSPPPEWLQRRLSARKKMDKVLKPFTYIAAPLIFLHINATNNNPYKERYQREFERSSWGRYVVVILKYEYRTTKYTYKINDNQFWSPSE